MFHSLKSRYRFFIVTISYILNIFLPPKRKSPNFPEKKKRKMRPREMNDLEKMASAFQVSTKAEKRKILRWFGSIDSR